MRKNKIKSNFLYRQLILAIFVALFFSLSMTWVEMDPIIDHQKNVEILRSNQQQDLKSESLSEPSHELHLVNDKRVRQTDGLIFGSAFVVIIIVGGVIAHNRKF